MELDTSSEGGHVSDDATVIERLVDLCMPKKKFLTVKSIHEKSFIGILALWHSYLMWLAACTFTCFTSNTMLVWIVEWFAMTHAYSVSGLLVFFGTVFKCFMLVHVTSDVLRFALLLGRDAWREDAFEGYRRMVVGKGGQEVTEGVLYGARWPLDQPGCKTWGPDIGFQYFIYFTLDVLPWLMLFIAKVLRLSSMEQLSAFIAMAMVNVACGHVLLFYLAWMATDISQKVAGLRRALHKADRAIAVHLSTDEEGEEDDVLGADEDASSATSYDGEDPDKVNRGGKPMFRRSTAGVMTDQRNICIAICNSCSCLESMVPQLWLLSILVVGILIRQPLLVAAALMIACTTICYAFSWRRFRECGRRRESDYELDMRKKWPLLQHWGEKYCNLGFHAQADQRSGLAVMMAFFIVLFAWFGWGWYTVACMACLFICTCKQLLVAWERPWGWVVGIAEGLLFAFGTALVCLIFQKQARCVDAFLVLLLSLLRQFGLARHIAESSHVRRGVMAILNVVELFLILVVILCVTEAGVGKTYSAYPCSEGSPNCTYIPIEYRQPLAARDIACTLRFPMGNGELRTVADFGLMSSLTYESSTATIQEQLHRYFPGWVVEREHRSVQFSKTNPYQRGLDWTSFYQFSDPYNLTTVFAVRGTQHIIDALQDIHLWFPAATVQLFEKIGPSIASGWADAIVSVVGRSSMRSTDELLSFGVLLDEVQKEMAAHPERLFYITGHSLGGGVAKLVAAEIESRKLNLKLPAVVFSAPGLEITSTVVYGHSLQSELRSSAVTVQPANDVVSRIDGLGSAIVPTACEGGPLTCHGVMNTVCNIYADCGSMRQGGGLSLPCGACSGIVPGSECP